MLRNVEKIIWKEKNICKTMYFFESQLQSNTSWHFLQNEMNDFVFLFSFSLDLFNQVEKKMHMMG